MLGSFADGSLDVQKWQFKDRLESRRGFYNRANAPTNAAKTPGRIETAIWPAAALVEVEVEPEWVADGEPDVAELDGELVVELEFDDDDELLVELPKFQPPTPHAFPPQPLVLLPPTVPLVAMPMGVLVRFFALAGMVPAPTPALGALALPPLKLDGWPVEPDTHMLDVPLKVMLAANSQTGIWLVNMSWV